eukprot:scaffold25232_cov274-Skeletonema_marinoi.AAC.1
MIIVEKEGSLLLSKLFSTLTMIVLRCRYSGRFDRFSLLLQYYKSIANYLATPTCLRGDFADVLRMPQMKFGYFAVDEFC